MQTAELAVSPEGCPQRRRLSSRPSYSPAGCQPCRWLSSRASYSPEDGPQGRRFSFAEPANLRKAGAAHLLCEHNSAYLPNRLALLEARRCLSLSIATPQEIPFTSPPCGSQSLTQDPGYSLPSNSFSGGMSRGFCEVTTALKCPIMITESSCYLPGCSRILRKEESFRSVRLANGLLTTTPTAN